MLERSFDARIARGPFFPRLISGRLMLFNSFEFLEFLAVVVPGYFFLPDRFRPLWLAVASYYFYMFSHPEYGWVLFTSTMVSYLGGLAMGRWESAFQRRFALGICIVVNLGLLFFFKYADLFVSTWNTWMHALHHYHDRRLHHLHLALPVGISFFTFQALSYCFDVYSRRFPTERRLDVFAAYKSFFPQLVAGPIERPGSVVPQIRGRHRFDYDRMLNGLRLMLWGYFKKLVIADRLAVVVREVYGSPAQHSSLQLIVATYAFTFQIFCDFSGYTDIARGCARILGINLVENFRAPYLAKSIPEFWSRWHISLSTWFRDYLYIPLGGNRVGIWRWPINIMIVFLVSGFWHGADWKFVVWGALHGFYFLGSKLFSRIPLTLPSSGWLRSLGGGVQIFVTFHLVAFAWIFFRANHIEDAMQIVDHIRHHPLEMPVVTPLFGPSEFWIAGGALALLGIAEFLRSRGSVGQFLDRCPLLLRWSVYYAVIFAILIYAPHGEKEFIYFKF